MKFTKFIAILLLTVLLNSHILAIKETITYSNHVYKKRLHKNYNHRHRRMRDGPDNKSDDGISLKVDRNKCEQDTIDWGDFLLEAFSKMTSGFTTDVVTLVKSHVDNFAHSNKLYLECKNEIISLYHQECEHFNKNLEFTAEGGLKNVVDKVKIQGLSKDQYLELVSLKGKPQAICKFAKKMAKKKLKSADEWTESAKVDLELINLAIDHKWTLEKVEKISHDLWHRKIKKNFYQLVMNYMDPNEDKATHESKFPQVLLQIKKDIEESMNVSKQNHDKALHMTDSSDSTQAQKDQIDEMEKKQIQLPDTENIGDINCGDLPEKVGYSYVCLNIGVATKVKAFWSMFSREKRHLLPKCIISLLPTSLLKAFLDVTTGMILGIISNFLGLMYFKVTYFSLKIIWYMYKTYSHNKLFKKYLQEKEEIKKELNEKKQILQDRINKKEKELREEHPEKTKHKLEDELKSNKSKIVKLDDKYNHKLKEINDKVEQELTKKSENLGKAVGTFIRIILISVGIAKKRLKLRKKK